MLDAQGRENTVQGKMERAEVGAWAWVPKVHTC